MVKKDIKIGKINIYIENFGNIANPTFLLAGAGASARFWKE